MIRWFHVEPQGVDPCAYVPGLYTQAQVDDLINIDGYIPVADAAEFDKIRTGVSETMGGCSIWAGTYTTGLDKKYIQIFNSDWTGETLTPIGTLAAPFTGVYDGNNLITENISYTASTILDAAFFGYVDGAEIKNIKMLNSVITAGNTVVHYVSILVSRTTNSSVVSNCTTENCSIINAGGTQAAQMGLICGANVLSSIIDCDVISCILTGLSFARGGFVGVNSGTVSNCFVDGLTITDSFNTTGAFVGENTVTGDVLNCSVKSCDNFTGPSFIGGFVGLNRGKIEECYANAFTVTGTSNDVGGFVGRHVNTASGIISNCYTKVNSVGGIRSGGFMGTALSGSASVITNCYSIGSASGSSPIGGFIALRQAGLTINNCYWDTTASGNATSAGGTGQTTVALQTPTSNTGIYSAWSLAIWDFGTSVEYPSLINTP